MDKLIFIIRNLAEDGHAETKVQADLLYMTLWVVSNLLWEDSVAKMIMGQNTHCYFIKLLDAKNP